MNGAGAKVPPSIEELRAKAKAEIFVNDFASIDSLVNLVRECIGQVNIDIGSKRPDRAYIEHVKATEILKLISQHGAFPYLKQEKGERYSKTLKEYEAQKPMIAEVEHMIDDDYSQALGVRHNGTHSEGSRRSSIASSVIPSASAPLPPQAQASGRYGSAAAVSGELFLDKKQPNGSNSSATDPLMARFNQLRANTPTQGKTPYPVDDGQFVRYVTAMGSGQRNSLSQLPSKPLGPREMPYDATKSPPPPPKIPLHSSVEAFLPRAPSPIYSPARNIQAPASITPPRTTSRNLRHSQLGPERARPPGPGLPNSTRITAEELCHSFKHYSILIIDVRPREQFDEGHIFTKSVVCIEPLAIHYGDQLDELFEKLVYSPDGELELLEQISDYDLIVYHDQNTSSDRFLQGSPRTAPSQSLRFLHDIFTEFNYSMPLKRSPSVLLGGIDAWTNLMGYNALQSSNTHIVPTSQRLPKPSRRPVHRISIAGGNSSREIRARRLRDHEPLNAEEAREWQEKATNEEVGTANIQDFIDSDTESALSQQGTPVNVPFHSLDDFYRRFPEVHAIPSSMVSPPEQIVAQVRPAVPPVPSRPVPAAARPSFSGVSERDVSQQPRQHQANQLPLYASRFIMHSLRLPRTGLVNFGVTCYMNATIQCLLATIPLSQFFLEETWRINTQENWKGSNGVMPKIFANLIRMLWKNEQAALRPVSLRRLCARLNPEWGVDIQQDAKEFFDFIVDCLHEDLNVRWKSSALKPLTAAQELNRENTAINEVSRIEWDRYSHREKSFVSALFAGQHSSRLRCTTCKNTSTTYEAFYSISIEIPLSGVANINDCLRSYCQEELLSGDEEWRCPYCKQQRAATKRIRITRLPQILVIHLKRFSASKTESARKIHTPIDFPLYGLDMQPYMADTFREPGPGESSGTDPATTPPFSYDAYGVMRHIGSTGDGGHYIALVRDAARRLWRKFDDERISDFEPARLKPADRLQNEQAYILFYERSRGR